MAEDDEKPKAALFGSAGMAASGMMPGARLKRKGKQNPPTPDPEETAEGKIAPEEIEEPSAEEDAVVEKDVTAREETIVEEPPKEEDPPPVPAFTGKRAVVVGHTGSGDFGQELDKVFQRLDGVRLFALCDANGEAVEDSKTNAAAPVGYARFSEMMEQQTPDLVCVASAWSNQHHDLIKTSIEAGASVLCAPPLTQTLKEADELVSLAAEKKLSIAVAHTMRSHPLLKQFYAEREKLIGDLLEMRVFGAMDETAGGEDLVLNGMPLFDIVRWFGGEVSYCTASISKEGMPAIAEDAHESASLKLGPLLGDTIHAEFMLESGIRASFVSDARLRDAYGSSGIEFIGSKSRMRLFAGPSPVLSLLWQSAPSDPNRSDHWKLWPKAKGDYHPSIDKLSGIAAANRFLVHDWLDAIAEARQPESSGESARKALEMVHGIWQAGVTMKRAYFPLVNRLHPLSEETR